MAKLFKDKIIKQKLENFEIPEFEEKLDIVKKWYKAYKDGSLKAKTETQCEQAFNEDFFVKILDYSKFPSTTYTIEPKATTDSSTQTPDAILGYFEGDKKISVSAVVEIKDANKNLEKPQQRVQNDSPIQQAFKYKPQFKSCKFVIATNFIEIRLFQDNQIDFENFTLEGLLDSNDDYFEFRKFYFLLNVRNFVTKEGKTKTESILSEIRVEQEKITKEFYKKYKLLRQELIRNILEKNKKQINELNLSQKDKMLFIIEKAQKIIDRIIFICFCEDLDLLPDDTLKKTIEFNYNTNSLFNCIWDVFKYLFEKVDKGSKNLEIPDGYNGELFKPDSDLDSLVIDDDICKKFSELGKYDFSEDLSINILGHIFEQSISDIEELKNLYDEDKPKTSKRKKDGIFYTPDYIVDYIVKNALGNYLEEQEKKIMEKHNLKVDITDKNYQKRAITAYIEYQDVLRNVKILDPACGSGAFLVKVFDYLLEENKRVGKILGLDSGIADFTDVYKNILQNNIYGVDLNSESVEITKLSLWLKTAQKGKKLAILENNIKCGNSLIDDPVVAGDKAFKWGEEFKNIMDGGGFDVVVGNPPYVPIENISKNDRAYLEKIYQSAFGRLNIYPIFYEKGIKLLKHNGFLGFITPYTLLKNKYYIEARKILLEYSIDIIVDFSGSKIFIDAAVDSIILIIRKTKSKDNKIKILTNIQNFQNQDYCQSYCNQAGFQKNYDLSFNIKQNKLVFSKIYTHSIKIKDIINFKQGITTGGDKIFIHSEDNVKTLNLENELLKPIIGGRNIKKYLTIYDNKLIIYLTPKIRINNYPNIHKFMLPFEEKLSQKRETKQGKLPWWSLHWPRNEMMFNQDRILLRQTGSYPICSIDNSNLFTTDSIHNGVIKNQNFNIKYLVSLLNSKLLRYIYEQQINESGKTFAQVKIIYINELPIKNINLSEQNNFVLKTDLMMKHKKELYQKLDKFLQLIQHEYYIEKTPRKLKKFYELDFDEFVKALKIKDLSLDKKSELLEFFEKNKKEVSDIKAEIDKQDKIIDDMVFDLYGLTEEERRIVMKST